METRLWKAKMLATKWLYLMNLRCSTRMFSAITSSPPNEIHCTNSLNRSRGGGAAGGAGRGAAAGGGRGGGGGRRRGGAAGRGGRGRGAGGGGRGPEGRS